MENRVVYYTDELNDEFSGTKITRRPLPKNYKYYHSNIVYRFLSALIYYLALPWLWIVLKCKGYRVKGGKNVRRLRKQAVFFYGNHTSISDALVTQAFVSRGKKTYIVCNQDTTSIKGIRWLVKLLGAIPTPENPEEAKKFVECIEYHASRKKGIAIFPEAHIWPYSTHIRPFPDDSFVYPAKSGAPVIAFATTYRARKNKKKPPLPTVHVSRPFYPDMNKSLAERKKELRNQVYDFLLEKAAEEENYEYIAYVRKKEGE